MNYKDLTEEKLLAFCEISELKLKIRKTKRRLNYITTELLSSGPRGYRKKTSYIDADMIYAYRRTDLFEYALEKSQIEIELDADREKLRKLMLDNLDLLKSEDREKLLKAVKDGKS